MKHILFILFLTLSCNAFNLQAASPKWKKPVASTSAKSAQKKTDTTALPFDTIVPSSNAVVVSGFEKKLRATRESMFIANNTDREIVSLVVEITYFDTNKQMLHKATHSVSETIPAGERRMISVPTFDRQNLFYYHKTAISGYPAQATPFEVSVIVKSICHPINSN